MANKLFYRRERKKQCREFCGLKKFEKILKKLLTNLKKGV